MRVQHATSEPSACRKKNATTAPPASRKQPSDKQVVRPPIQAKLSDDCMIGCRGQPLPLRRDVRLPSRRDAKRDRQKCVAALQRPNGDRIRVGTANTTIGNETCAKLTREDSRTKKEETRKSRRSACTKHAVGDQSIYSRQEENVRPWRRARVCSKHFTCVDSLRRLQAR
ncbi:hypothetical protein MRX96_006422 [Rhipicephalus microplus]